MAIFMFTGMTCHLNLFQSYASFLVSTKLILYEIQLAFLGVLVAGVLVCRTQSVLKSCCSDDILSDVVILED